MADIELVIKIPKEMYKWVNDVNKFFNDYGTSDFIDLVKNGTVLPKGHGKLKDIDKIINDGISKGFCDWYDEMKYADTIIEADKERANETVN